MVKGVGVVAAAATLIAFGMALENLRDSGEIILLGGSNGDDMSADLVEEVQSPTATSSTPPEETSSTVSTTTAAPTSTTTTTTAPTTTTTAGPTEIRLTDLEMLDSYGTEVGSGGVALLESDFIVWCQSISTSGVAEYRLDRGYSRLTGFVGYSDNSPSNQSSEFWIEDENGKILFPKVDLSVGDSREIDIDVSDVIRLKIQCNGWRRWVGLADGMLTLKNS